VALTARELNFDGFLVWKAAWEACSSNGKHCSICLETEGNQEGICQDNRSHYLCFVKTFIIIVRVIRNTQIHSQIIRKQPDRTSQETYYVSATKPNRLMLFGEKVSVYCDSLTKYITGKIQIFFELKQEAHVLIVIGILWKVKQGKSSGRSLSTEVSCTEQCGGNVAKIRHWER
jgi:hypothetical protein